MGKFVSRKLFVALGGVMVAVLTNVGLPPEVAERITDAVVFIACTYLGGQSAVDVVESRKTGKAE